MAPLDPDLIAPELSNRIVVPILHHIAEVYGEDVLEATLAEAGLPDAYLRDLEKWVSYEYIQAVTEALYHQVGDGGPLPPHAHPFWQNWRQFGRRTFQRDITPQTRFVLKWAGSPRMFFQRLPELSRRANNVMNLKAIENTPGRALLRCANPATHSESPGACWNRIGLFEAVPEVWGMPRAEVRSLACVHDPDDPADHCLYEVRYIERDLRPALISAAGVLAGGWLGASLIGPGLGAFAGAVSAGLALSAWWMRRVGAERDDALRELNASMAASDARYRELWLEQQALRRALLANRKISGFLPDALVEEIMENPELEVELGGRRTEGAILFADIVGFTPRCERHAPEQVVRDLNVYFGYADPLLAARGGIIDKRMGDGIMAVFVDKEGEPDCRYRALKSGLEILAALDACNRDLQAIGSDPIQIRLGVAAGSLVLGNVGSDVKLEYTVIGDVVNLAARLESNASHGTLLTQASLLPWIESEASASERRKIQVKGKSVPIDVVELHGLQRACA